MLSSPSMSPALMGETSFSDMESSLKTQTNQEIGQQFDTILWRSFLESALKPTKGQPGLLKGTGPGADLQFSLVVDTLAQAMAQGQSLGFGELLSVKSSEVEKLQ